MSETTVSIIVAIDEDGAIGRNNRLPWGKIPSDLKRFKKITTGHDVIMGRNTFESLPTPLVGRRNIVMSRSPEYKVTHRNCEVVSSAAEALSAVRCSEEVFVIGGAKTYKLFLPMAEYMYITTIHGRFNGDVSFPEWNKNDWKVASTVEVPISQNEIPTSFRVWGRTEALRL